MAAAEVLSFLLAVNLAAAAAIVVVAAIRKPVRRMFGARTAYGLWLLPLLTVAGVLWPARVILIQPSTVQAPAPILGLLSDPSTDAASAIDPAALLMVLWLAGAAAALCVMIQLQRRFAIEAARGRVGPAVVGMIGPRIVTPLDFEERFTPEERALVLAHEETHLARQHSRINALSAVIQCLCWFNPLVHLAAWLARIDQELACDEAVVLRFPEARRTYADALVKAQLAIRPLPVGCYWPSGTEHPLLERIAMLKITGIGPGRRFVGASVLALLCAATAAGAWAAKPAQVRVATSRPAARTPFIPEMRPTGEMIPAYGSYPAGTPAAHIAVTTPVMTPTGAVRPVFDPAAVPQELAQAPVQPGARPALPPTGFKDWDEAEANGPAVAIEGTVTRVRWINPRTLITVVDASGVETTVQSQTPNTLLRHGITRDVLKAGAPIHLEGYRRDDGTVLVRASAMSSQGRLLGGQGLPRQGIPPEVDDRSVLTNSVIREEPPKPLAPRSAAPGVVFARQPTAEEFRAAFPERALRMEKTGRVGVACSIGGEGVLENCTVRSDAEPGYGFDEAALQLTAAFRANTTGPNGESLVGQTIVLPIDFRMK